MKITFFDFFWRSSWATNPFTYLPSTGSQRYFLYFVKSQAFTNNWSFIKILLFYHYLLILLDDIFSAKRIFILSHKLWTISNQNSSGLKAANRNLLARKFRLVGIRISAEETFRFEFDFDAFMTPIPTSFSFRLKVLLATVSTLKS